MRSEQQFIEAVLDAPYLFKIQVEDNEALPEELSKKEALHLELKSPTMGVLFQVSKVFLQLPKEDLKVLDGAEDFSERLQLIERHMDTLLEVMALLLHGKESAPPAWYVLFLRNNLTKKEVLEILTESLARLDTSFFLTSLKGIQSMSLLQGGTTP